MFGLTNVPPSPPPPHHPPPPPPPPQTAFSTRLEPIKNANPDVSWADLIVLAGTLALEQASGAKPSAGQIVASPFSFCPGRTDASSAAGTETLAPRVYPSQDTAFKDNAAVQGLTWRDAVALAARPRRCVRYSVDHLC
jgi:hypothetical protein